MHGAYGPHEDCTICLITRQKEREGRTVTQYLMVRNNRGMNAGLYNFPGGHLEENEALYECNTREVAEETGIIVENPELCGRFEVYLGQPEDNSWYLPPRIRVFIYKSDKFSGKLRNPLLKPGQCVPEVKAFWCDEDKIPFEHMRDNDRDWFKLYEENGYVNNPVYIRENNKMTGSLAPWQVEEAKKENEVWETEQTLWVKFPRLAEKWSRYER